MRVSYPQERKSAAMYAAFSSSYFDPTWCACEERCFIQVRMFSPLTAASNLPSRPRSPEACAVSNPAIGWPIAAALAKERVNRKVNPHRTLESIVIPCWFETFPGGRSIEDNEEGSRKQNTGIDTVVPGLSPFPTILYITITPDVHSSTATDT